MNEYDHEDAFKYANRCAGRLTALADALKLSESKEQGQRIISVCMDNYEKLFTAFLEGVDFGRRHPMDMSKK